MHEIRISSTKLKRLFWSKYLNAATLSASIYPLLQYANELLGFEIIEICSFWAVVALRKLAALHDIPRSIVTDSNLLFQTKEPPLERLGVKGNTDHRRSDGGLSGARFRPFLQESLLDDLGAAAAAGT